jgi:hypothetical protein
MLRGASVNPDSNFCVAIILVLCTVEKYKGGMVFNAMMIMAILLLSEDIMCT